MPCSRISTPKQTHKAKQVSDRWDFPVTITLGEGVEVTSQWVSQRVVHWVHSVPLHESPFEHEIRYIVFVILSCKCLTSPGWRDDSVFLLPIKLSSCWERTRGRGKTCVWDSASWVGPDWSCAHYVPLLWRTYAWWLEALVLAGIDNFTEESLYRQVVT